MNPETKKTTSCGGVVLNSEKQILVVNQRGRAWSLPKGHIEAGESEEACARREIHEESGVREVRLLKKLGEYERYKIGLDGGDDKSELKHLVFFLYETSQTELKPLDPDNPEAKWLDKNEVVAQLTHPADKAFFEKVLKGL